MDVPGDTNFNGDLPYLLKGVDAAVLPRRRRRRAPPHPPLLVAVREAGLPAIVFINKMDRDRADFDMAFNGLSSTLGMKPVILYMPVMTGRMPLPASWTSLPARPLCSVKTAP